MKPLYALIISALLSGIYLISCTDQFNDPNPKGDPSSIDSIAPFLTLTSPIDGGIYADSSKVYLMIMDSLNLKSVKVEIAAIDASVPPFMYNKIAPGKIALIDTFYRPGVSDTTAFQMLIQASDSSGNVLAKTVNFKIH